MCCKIHGSRGENIFALLGTSLFRKILKGIQGKSSIFFSLGAWCLMVLVVSPEILFWFWRMIKIELGLTRTKVLGGELEREKSAAVAFAQEIIDNNRSVASKT